MKVSGKIKWAVLALGALLLTFAFYAYYSYFYEFHEVEVTSEEQEEAQPIELPHSVKAPTSDRQLYAYTAQFKSNLFSADKIRIIADDRIVYIRVNGQEASLEDYTSKQLHDFNNGIVFELESYVQSGKNSIEIGVENLGGIYGLQMKTVKRGSKYQLLRIMILIVVAAFFTIMAMLFGGCSRLSCVFLLLAVIVQMLYLSMTTFSTRTHDISYHLTYIHKIYASWGIPIDFYTHHPPLYYFICAFLKGYFKFLGAHNGPLLHSGFQVFSVFLMGTFMLYACKTIDFLIRENVFKVTLSKLNQVVLRICFYGAICFWPAVIIHSCRIGNDLLSYAFSGGGIYYLICWYYKGEKKSLILFLIFAALSGMSKATGFVLFGPFFVILFFKAIWRKEYWKHLKIAGVAIAVCGVAGSFCFGASIYKMVSANREHLIMGDVQNFNRDLIVKNFPPNYLYLDTEIFLNKPWINSWDDEYGRQYFLNYFLSTSLFGEFYFKGKFNRSVALLFRYLLLGYLLYILYGIIHYRKEDVVNMAPALLLALMMYGAVAFLRFLYPINIDFRYALPILTAWGILYVHSILYFRNKERIVMEYVGYLLPILMMLSGMAVFLNLKFSFL